MSDSTHAEQVGAPFNCPLITTLACTACANAGAVRSVTLSGREYVVFPVVPIRQGVLNGHFVSAKEIERSTPGWNGRPLTLNHPTVDGEYVSANSPQMWEEFGVGWLFNARFTDGCMVAEGWIDKTRLAAMGQANIVASLLHGAHMDVSTGYFCEVRTEEGEFNGETYAAVQSAIVPDHLALLPNGVGACSWDDGCGIPRVNQGGSMEPENSAPEAAAISDAEMNQHPPVVDDAPVVPLPARMEQEEAAIAAEPAVPPFVLPQELEELAAMLREFGGVSALRETLAGLQSAANARRAAAVNRVITLSANALTPADLEGVSEDVLDKMAQALQPATYAGRAPVANNGANGERWMVLPPTAQGGA